MQLKDFNKELDNYFAALNNLDHDSIRSAYKDILDCLKDYFIQNEKSDDLFDAFESINEKFNRLLKANVIGNNHASYVHRLQTFLIEKSTKLGTFYFFDFGIYEYIKRPEFGDSQVLYNEIINLYNSDLIKIKNRKSDYWIQRLNSLGNVDLSFAYYFTLLICKRTNFDNPELLRDIDHKFQSLINDNNLSILLEFDRKTNLNIVNEEINYGEKDIEQNQYLAFLVVFYKVNNTEPWVRKQCEKFIEKIVINRDGEELKKIDLNKRILLKSFLNNFKLKITTKDWDKLLYDANCCGTFKNVNKIAKMCDFIISFLETFSEDNPTVIEMRTFLHERKSTDIVLFGLQSGK
jgi:hypothetical protein